MEMTSGAAVIVDSPSRPTSLKPAGQKLSEYKEKVGAEKWRPLCLLLVGVLVLESCVHCPPEGQEEW